MRAALEAWQGLTCTALASHDSERGMGIQLADMLAGVFRYMTSCAFGNPARTVRFFDEGRGDQVEMRLDEFFHVVPAARHFR